MRTIVVGDIHGHIKSVEDALKFDGNVVFVGDYLDSFHQSVDNQLLCLNTVMDAVEAEPDRVVALLGNHEMSYLEPSMQCSGWKMQTSQLVKHLVDRMHSILKIYHWVGDYLISHAGIDQMLLDEKELTAEEYLEAGEFNQIGRVRGGYSWTGGLYWNDFNREMTPPNDLKQVVGHSNWQPDGDLEGVRVKYSKDDTGEVWCVDNLNRKAEVLLIEEDIAYPIPLVADEE